MLVALKTAVPNSVVLVDLLPASAAAEGVVDLPNELTAGGAQDLFVYNLPKLTLGKDTTTPRAHCKRGAGLACRES